MTSRRLADRMASLSDLIGVDARSLAVMRMGVAINILGDLAIRSRALRAHYTDFGVLPRSPVLSDGKRIDFFFPSFHMLGGSVEFQAALFALAAILAVLLLIGYRTRVVSVLSWLFLVSMQHRNPLLNHGEDVVLVCVLFFAMFMPWERRFSVDAVRRREGPREPDSIVSAASFGYTLQIALVYLFGALLKTGPAWRVEGTALYYALATDGIVLPFGTYLLQFPTLLWIGTWGTMVLEFGAPLLLFIPFGTPWLRLAAILAITGLQIFIGLSFSLGLFPLINVIALIGLIPALVWERFPVAGVRRIAERTRERVELLVPPRPVRSWPRALRVDGPLLQMLPALAVAYIVATNLTTLSPPLFEMPERIALVGSTLNLEQRWAMFAPTPYRDGGWYVTHGRTRGGRRVDVRSGERPTWDRPERIVTTYPIFRWFKYLRRISSSGKSTHFDLYAQYLCRAWNASHQGDEHLDSVRIYYVREYTLPDYEKAPAERVFLWKHRCGEGGLVPRAKHAAL